MKEEYHASHLPGRVVKNLGTFWVWKDFALPWRRYILLRTALEDLKQNLVLSDFVNTLCCPGRDASSFSPPWKSGKQIGYFLNLSSLHRTTIGCTNLTIDSMFKRALNTWQSTSREIWVFAFGPVNFWVFKKNQNFEKWFFNLIIRKTWSEHCTKSYY